MNERTKTLIRQRIGGILGLLIYMGVGAQPQALATVLPPWSIEEVVSRADVGLIGVVRDTTCIRPAQHLLTEVTIDVEEVLLGRPTKPFMLTLFGGHEGSSTSEIIGSPHLEAGQRVLLLTRLGRDGRHYIVGLSLGLFVIERQTLVQTIDTPTLGSQGDLRKPYGRRAFPMERIRAALRKRQP
ncbi:MAG: hypothetical protein R3C68_04960 [Myxococcota bacterium]